MNMYVIAIAILTAFYFNEMKKFRRASLVMVNTRKVLLSDSSPNIEAIDMIESYMNKEGVDYGK